MDRDRLPSEAPQKGWHFRNQRRYWLKRLPVILDHNSQSIPGAANGAAYLSLKNTGDDAVTLVGMSSEVAKVTELHTHIHADGMMRMENVPSKVISPGESLIMQPGGYHVMLMGLKQPLGDNGTVRIVLNFADGTQQTLDVGIRKP